MTDVMIYMFDLVTGEYKSTRPAQLRPNGQPITDVCGGTPVAPPEVPEGHVACWTGTCWETVEDHRQKMDEKGRKYGGTSYWLPSEGDGWNSPERYTDTLGPLPDGAVTERPEKPAPTLEEEKAHAVTVIDRAVSTSILAGFDYETDPGTGTSELLHFSYDSFDQQNFADSANVATLAMSGAAGLPTSVTWNAYRNYTVDTGGELVRLVFEPSSFLRLYTAGALVHKATQMELGGQRKEAVGVAASVEEIRALLAGWGL